MNKRTIFSGIQPSGDLHLGNHIGAISQWVKLQNPVEVSQSLSGVSQELVLDKPIQPTSTNSTNELIFCIVDLHAITVPQDPKVLREKILEVAALYIASGIDPKKSHIFVQSDNPDHSYLAWLFNCITPLGWLERMTQFKDKSSKLKAQNSNQESVSTGLFDYPVLMASDILLYDTDLVPVGQDQKQHIELTRDIAERFNHLYCRPELVSGSELLTTQMPKPHAIALDKQVQHDTHIFKLPQPMIDTHAARIMSLQNPTSKMSKSDKDPAGTINLLDPIDDVVKKIKRAVTDSGTDIVYAEDKPALKNLLTIYSQISGKATDELEKQYTGVGYGKFKEELAQAVVDFLKPVQSKYKEVRENKSYLEGVLNEGRDFAIAKSRKKVEQVKTVMGLGR